MSSMNAWVSLLGLPLDAALDRARAAGVEPVVVTTCAPRRGKAAEVDDAAANRVAAGATERVIRVCEGPEGLQLTVSAFMDGDPRKE